MCLYVRDTVHKRACVGIYSKYCLWRALCLAGQHKNDQRSFVRSHDDCMIVYDIWKPIWAMHGIHGKLIL